jgi:malate dehydrogenase
MTREELIGINAGIVKQLLKVCWFIPNAIIVVVSMDTMTYLALKSTGLPKQNRNGWGT